MALGEGGPIFKYALQDPAQQLAIVAARCREVSLPTAVSRRSLVPTRHQRGLRSEWGWKGNRVAFSSTNARGCLYAGDVTLALEQ